MTPEQIAAKYGYGTSSVEDDEEKKRGGTAESIAAKYLSQDDEQPVAPTVAEPAAEPEEAPSTWDHVRHVIGGLPQAAFDIGDLPSTLRGGAEAAANWATGRDDVDLRVPQAAAAVLGPGAALWNTAPSDAWPEAKEFLAKETLDPGESPVADALRTGVEWGSGGVANVARKGVSVAPDLLMGGGAFLGDLASNNIGDGEGSAGELVGGTAGMIASLLRGKPSGVDNAAKKAHQFIEMNLEDPEAAAKAGREYLQGGAREMGTLADITRDRGLFNVEAGQTIRPSFKRKVSDLDLARQGQIAEEVKTPFGTARGSDAQKTAQNYVEEASKNIGRRTARLDQAVGRRLDETLEDITRQTDEVAGTTRAAQEAQEAGATRLAAAQDEATAAALPDDIPYPHETSEGLSKAVNAEHKNFIDTVRKPAWKAFDELPQMDVFDAVAEVGERLNQYDPTALRLFNKKHGDVMGIINTWEDGVATPKQIHAFVKSAKDKINTAYKTETMGEPEKMLDEMVKAFEDTLSTGSGQGNQLYKNARAASAEEYARFKQGRLGNVRKKKTPETFAKDMGLSGEQGVATARIFQEVGQDGALMPQLVEHMKALAKQEGITPAFMRKYGQVIDTLPADLRGELQRVLDAEAGVKAATKDATILERARAKAEADLATRETRAAGQQLKAETAALEGRAANTRRARQLQAAVDKTNLANYGKQPTKTLNSMMVPDGGDDLGRLYRSLEKRGEGEAFKASVRDWMENKYLNRSAGGQTGVTPDSRREFYKVKDTLVDSGMVTQEQADQMQKAFDRTMTVKQRTDSWAEITDRFESEIENLTASAAAAVALQMAPGSSLVLAGAVRRATRKLMPKILRGGEQTKEIQALENFLLNPEEYFKYAEGAKTAEESARRILTEVVGASQAAELIAGDDEDAP